MQLDCIYIYMGAARFPGPPNLHDLQNWFKQLILQLPICICIIQHVTWEISLPSFIETVQGVRSAPHRSFTLHKVFQRLAKENKEKYWKKKVETVPSGNHWGCPKHLWNNLWVPCCCFEICDIDLITEKMQTWIPDIYVDSVKMFMKFIEMYGNLVNAFLKFSS